MLSLYYPTKTVLRGSNVDGEEKMELLMPYVEWLQQQCKANSKANKQLKSYMKDILLTEMKVELDNANDRESMRFTTKNDNIIYYVLGYIICRFIRGKKHCSK